MDSQVTSNEEGQVQPAEVSPTKGREIGELLKTAGLRPTRQRLLLGGLLFNHGDRHATAEMLHAEAVASGERVSVATVYNTLHQFCEAGLLRELAIEGTKAYFDTNTSNHSHFFVEDEGHVRAVAQQTLEQARQRYHLGDGEQIAFDGGQIGLRLEVHIEEDQTVIEVIGDEVGPEKVLCIIEAMKVMNEIKAEMSGVVRDVLVKNGQAVEFGEPMFLIEKK